MNSRKKRGVAWICAGVLILAQSSPVWGAPPPVRFVVDGTEWVNTVFVEQPIYDERGRLEVPLSYLSAWGYGVRMEDDALVAQIQDGNSEKRISMPFCLKHGVAYVAVREALNALGDQVVWDRVDKKLTIETGGLSGQIQVHFIDVGEGDSALIDVGDFEVLIDAGLNEAGPKVVNYLKPYVDGDLDLVIATHVHHDHIGGMDDVLRAYRVNRLIHCGDTYTTQSYLDYQAALQQQPNCQVSKDDDQVIDLGQGAVLRIFNITDGNENLNNNSVISQLEYGTVKVLFTGDMEQGAEIAGLPRFEKIDVLKVAHHGSSTSSMDAFLQVTKPEIGIISAGYGAVPKHPHVRALKRLFAANVQLYGTFKSGTIVLTTDGTTYQLDTDDTLTLNDGGIYHVATPKSPIQMVQ